MADLPFGDKLSALCAFELTAARLDPERAAAMVERLTNSLAFTIAILSKGDAKGMSDFLEGAIAYLMETAADHAKVGQFMEAVKGGRNGRR